MGLVLLLEEQGLLPKQASEPSSSGSRLVVVEMEGQLVKSRVARVSAVESWDTHVAQANAQGCPVLAHFTASWCAPSVAMNPFFQELASSFQDVLFLLVDVDEAKEVAKRMEVKAMPTFVLMKEGRVEAKLVGANPEEIRRRVATFALSHRPIAVV